MPLDHWTFTCRISHLKLYFSKFQKKESQKNNEARGIRTPNLRVWNPTRCRCAMAPDYDKDLPGYEPGSKDSESLVLTITPQVHMIEQNFDSTYFILFVYRVMKTKMRRPGIEPGPSAWKAEIITIRLSTRYFERSKWDLNPWPADLQSAALPLSYCSIFTAPTGSRTRIWWLATTNSNR